jgi:CO dehydrogenase maturation factor
MTRTIALAGKGGTGKTTISSLIIRALIERNMGPILAIDADPASNLHMTLGLDTPITIGEIREEMSQLALAGQLGVSISRQEHLTREVRMALEEGEQVDLLTMGRPEGQGCYCAVNHLLRDIIDDLGRHYRYVVIDNEAGMEHISRRTTQDVDLLLLATDPTLRGIQTASHMFELTQDLEIDVHEIKLILNRVQGPLPDALENALSDLKMDIAVRIPADPNVNEFDAIGRPLVQLGSNSPAWEAIQDLINETILPVLEKST